MEEGAVSCSRILGAVEERIRAGSAETPQVEDSQTLHQQRGCGVGEEQIG